MSVVLNSFDEKLVSTLRDGPLGLSELVRETGFARQTIHNHLQNLVEHGLVMKETLPGGRGRPKVKYRLTPGLPRDFSTTDLQVVMLPFKKLKTVCRHEKGGRCKRTRKHCDPSLCPTTTKPA